MDRQRIMTSRKRNFLLVVIPLLTVYLVFFFYGRLAIQPRNEALRLIDKAETQLIQQPLPKTRAEDIQRTKEYIALFEQASKINYKQYPILGEYTYLEAYINAVIPFMKEVLDYSEKIYSGSIVVTKESYEKKVAEFVSKRKSIDDTYWLYGRTHLWMRLIFLK